MRMETVQLLLLLLPSECLTNKEIAFNCPAEDKAVQLETLFWRCLLTASVRLRWTTLLDYCSALVAIVVGQTQLRLFNKTNFG